MAFGFLSRCSLQYPQCVVNFGQELDHAKFAFVLNCKRVKVSDVLVAVGDQSVRTGSHRPIAARGEGPLSGNQFSETNFSK